MQASENQYLDSVWQFANDEEKEKMLEPITTKNCGEKLILVRDILDIPRRELAQIIGCSESTLSRIERGVSLPNKNFILRLTALVTIGRHKYANLSEKEKDRISEVIANSAGVISGVAGAIGTILATGGIGLSAAGITSGISALGGGALLGGAGLIAAIPVSIGLASYGIVKGIKKICEANKLSCKEIDGKYEIRPGQEDDEEQDD